MKKMEAKIHAWLIRTLLKFGFHSWEYSKDWNDGYRDGATRVCKWDGAKQDYVSDDGVSGFIGDAGYWDETYY